LFSQNGLGDSYNIEVFLVDDGCNDGTSEMIKQDFSQVIIIPGTGELYWNRGMYLAWETASNTKDFDYYLWLNDDTFLFENALDTLFLEYFPNSIVCGTTKSTINENVTYGGYLTKKKTLLYPNNSFQNADYCNGNCVLVPKIVFKYLGNLDPFFLHALGDFDYSLRARKMDFKIKVAPVFVGYCEIHDKIPKWRSNSFSIIERMKNLYNPISGCNPKEFFVFDKRHYGIFTAYLHFLTIHLRLFFPKFWVNS